MKALPNKVRPPRLSSPARYAVAGASAALAAAIQLGVFPEPGIAPFVIFFAAVATASVLAGRGPGVLTTVLSAVAGNYFFIAPAGQLTTSGPGLTATLFFLVSAGAVAVLCGSLRAALEESDANAAALREADRRKDEFLGVLSHELRNPLAPIRNSIYLLNRTSLDERGRRAAAVIERQANHLSTLVDDLLDVTRIARGKVQLRLSNLDLADLVRRTVEDYRSLFAARQVRLEAELQPGAVWVDGDPTRLAQALGNLLNNAAKFTPAGGCARVSLALDDAGRAVLEVADSGVGIEPRTRERLFQPFAQGDRSLDRTGGGLGLGLALVKGLVDLHGGDVTVFSPGRDQGTRLTVRIPRQHQEPETLGSPPPGEPGAVRTSKARRVLVIEDNTDSADSLREVLELAGDEVTVAHDGKEGLAKARDVRPDVVLCDIGLPEMDGYEVAREFRRDPSLSSVFLVALTGYTQSEDTRRAHEAGFDRHIGKPPDLDALERLIAEAPRHASEDGEAGTG